MKVAWSDIRDALLQNGTKIGKAAENWFIRVAKKHLNRCFPNSNHKKHLGEISDRFLNYRFKIINESENSWECCIARIVENYKKELNRKDYKKEKTELALFSAATKPYVGTSLPPAEISYLDEKNSVLYGIILEFDFFEYLCLSRRKGEVDELAEELGKSADNTSQMMSRLRKAIGLSLICEDILTKEIEFLGHTRYPFEFNHRLPKIEDGAARITLLDITDKLTSLKCSSESLGEFIQSLDKSRLTGLIAAQNCTGVLAHMALKGDSSAEQELSELLRHDGNRSFKSTVGDCLLVASEYEHYPLYIEQFLKRNWDLQGRADVASSSEQCLDWQLTIPERQRLILFENEQMSECLAVYFGELQSDSIESVDLRRNVCLQLMRAYLLNPIHFFGTLNWIAYNETDIVNVVYALRFVKRLAEHYPNIISDERVQRAIMIIKERERSLVLANIALGKLGASPLFHLLWELMALIPSREAFA